MNQNVYAVAISASRVENGVKEFYVGVRRKDENFFSNEIDWNWYPESSIINFNKLIPKTNDNLTCSNNQTNQSSSYAGTMSRRSSSKNSRKKKDKSKQTNTKNDEEPNLRHVQIMRDNLLFCINVENPKLESCSKIIHSKFFPNDSNTMNKKITKILGYTKNQITGQIIWKVKLEENNRTIDISHADLIHKNRDLFVEYCRNNFVDNERSNYNINDSNSFPIVQ